MAAPLTVLLLGSGGREHALAWKLAQSPRLGRLIAAPGNPGIARHAEIADVDLGDHAGIVALCRGEGVDLVVVGPEGPLVDGIVDALDAAGVRCFGPTAAAARLEGSKGFTKDLCAEFGIPTAAYGRFADAASALAALPRFGVPVVVKADGLAAGKGVVVASTAAEAEAAVEACFAGSFGAAGAEVVIEAFLEGEEASLFALCDGTNALFFGTAQDHKRVGDGDTGPNTGGMGAYSPAPVLDAATVERAMAEIVRPTVAALAARGTPFRGILYAGLMIGAEGPQLIEYNVRFGDPECQVILPRLETDLLTLFEQAAAGALPQTPLAWTDTTALSVVLAARGYPARPAAGGEICGIEQAEAAGALVFQAGTKRAGDGSLRAAGGRVLNVTAVAATAAEAQAAAYRAVDAIDWSDGFCRRDIGWRAVAREHGA